MISTSRSYDVVILGSGIAGLAGALAAHALGLQPVVVEKAVTLGGGTVHSYGLIWVGQNHLAEAAGHGDTRDEVLAYMRFLGGGNIDDDRLSTFVDRSPEALQFFEKCGIRFRIVRGVTGQLCRKWCGRRLSPGRTPVEARFWTARGGNGSLGTVEEPPLYGIELHPAGGSSVGPHGNSRTGDSPATASHSGSLRVRQCRGHHRAGYWLPGGLVAGVIDDVQLPRRAAYAGRRMTRLVGQRGFEPPCVHISWRQKAGT